MTKVTMKNWAFNSVADKLNLPRACSCELFCGIKETEKAVYGLFFTGYGTGHAKHRACWIPKSGIENIENLTIIDDYDTAVQSFSNHYNQYV